ncbi:MAG: hypothetical protein QW548_02000 [Candidatus Aenigmatarchaeota archaeon]
MEDEDERKHEMHAAFAKESDREMEEFEGVPCAKQKLYATLDLEDAGYGRKEYKLQTPYDAKSRSSDDE